MRVISNKALTDFAALHPASEDPLQAWRRIVEASTFRGFAELRRTFNSVDRVGDFYVFDIGGNKYRLITAIHFESGSSVVAGDLLGDAPTRRDAPPCRCAVRASLVRGVGHV